MTNNDNALERLKAKREALYLAEVAAWLHMLGKCSKAFIKGDHSKDLEIPAEAPDALKEVLREAWWGHRVWDILQDIQEISDCSYTSQESVARLMKKHRKIGGCLPGLLQVAHGVGSGTEKPSLDIGANPSARYRSDAVGLEISPPSIYQVLQPYCSRLYENLADLLPPPQRGESNWDAWLSNFVQKVSAPFRHALADSRIPLNDVTLFDQTFTTVAAFKAALAQVILEGKWHPPNKEPRYHWRFLHVGVDSEAWWGQAVRLNDGLSRKATLDAALNNVKHLLEFEIPLGMEIYRDENGSMFLMPDVETLLDATDAEGNTLESQIQAIARAEFQGELLFNLTLSAPVRMLSMLTAFAQMISAPPAPLMPDVNQLVTHWAKAQRPPQGQPNTRELCSVCGLRPQGPSVKALNRQVCDVCLNRRLKQVEMWFSKPETTIWLDEIADQNGRIALIVGRFPLDEWLSGRAFDTVTTVEPTKRNATYCMLQESAKCFVEQPEIHLNPHAALLPVGGVWKHLVEAYPTAEALYRFLVDAAEDDSPDAPLEAWRLVLSMARQRPSPARIRRLWETTQNFWRRLDTDIEIEPRPKRYRLTGTISPKNPVRTHAYVLRKGRIAIPVVWDGEAFLTTINLNMLSRRLGDESLETFFTPEQTFVIEEPKGYGAVNKHFGEITILTAEETKTPYLPVRILMRTPRTFMALVPAERALAVVDWIAQRYHREMALVRNRLPIKLGVVFAPRRQPLRALLEAGSRFLTAPRLQAQEWQIIDIQEEQDGEKTVARTLILENGGRQIAWRVPLRRNDGAVEDVWYPYACLVHPTEQYPAEERQRAFAAPNPWTGAPKALWVHVSELYRGDRIHFLPSTFDFIWLGSAAKRFELLYNANGLRHRLPQRPYLLDETTTLSRIWETLDNKHLNKSQIYALRDVIEERRQRWQVPWGRAERGSIFWQFCRQALANAEWQNFQWDENDLNTWADYAARGWIADAVTLYLHISKGGED